MARDKTNKTPVATSDTRAAITREATEAGWGDDEHVNALRSIVYRATPSGRLHEHEVSIKMLDAHSNFEFDISGYRRNVEIARANADAENWQEARVYIAEADNNLTQVVLFLDEDRRLGAGQRLNLDGLRKARNDSTKANMKQRREKISVMLPETNLTKGALTKWIEKQLCKRHKITVTGRTIRSDLKALRG